jgi:hypothetical protein
LIDKLRKVNRKRKEKEREESFGYSLIWMNFMSANFPVGGD